MTARFGLKALAAVVLCTVTLGAFAAPPYHRHHHHRHHHHHVIVR